MIRHNFFTVSALVESLIVILLAAYLLTLRKRTRASLVLGMFFLSTGFLNLGYFYGPLILGPAGAWHRYLTVPAALFSLTFVAQLPYAFPQANRVREARLVLILSVAAALGVTAHFVFTASREVPWFDFGQHTYNFSRRAGQPTSILILTLELWFIIAMSRRVRSLEGRDRRTALQLLLAIGFTVLTPGVAHFLRTTGRIEAQTFQNLYVMSNLFGNFFTMMVFINHAIDRTSFMVKVIGISVVTLLAVVQVMSTVVLRQIESEYDTAHRHILQSWVAGKSQGAASLPLGVDDLEYIAEVGPDGVVRFPVRRSAAEGAVAGEDPLTLRIAADRSSVSDRAYREAGQDLYVTFRTGSGTSIYEAAFNYKSYRDTIHNIAAPISLLTIVLLVGMLVLFPVFFEQSLLRPLRRLLKGLRAVNKGDLTVRVPVTVRDEIGFLSDSFNGMVTGIQDARNQLREYAATLEARVEERTRDLASANQQLAQADEQKSAFFQNISHELRTPLTLIHGPVEAAVRKGEPLSVQTMEMLLAQTQRLIRLVNQLLDLQKLAQGRFTLEKSSIDPAAFIRETVEAFTPYAAQRGVSLVCETEEHLPWVEADVDQLEKCLYNYISNALKFTPQGGRIVVSGSRKDGMVRFEVADTGVGIPEDKVPHLFTRFGHSEAALTREHEGTGLGLSLVRELVALHGGNIGVTSKRGEGSRFWFDLPAVESARTPSSIWAGRDHKRAEIEGQTLRAQRTAESGQTYASSPPTLDWDLEGIRVLLVEDNSDLREYMGGILASSGCILTLAVDGDEALAKLPDARPDVIVTDLMMPRVSGDQLIAAVRQQREYRTTPVVLLTAKADEETRRTVREVGADNFLAKPFNDLELLTIVRNLAGLKAKERIFERELSTARMIQKNLLPPRPPDTSHLEVALYYEPAHVVGGDFYDFVEYPDGRVGLFVADVTGHGVPAAMIASMVKLVFSLEAEARSSPAELLQAMNHTLFLRTAWQPVSCLYLVFSADGTQLTYAVSGHPPFLLMRNDKPQFSTGEGFLMAALDGVEYENFTIALQPGDRVLVYTDALTEAMARQSDNPFGPERLAEAAAAQNQSPLGDQIRSMVAAVRSFQLSDEFRDDVTLIAVRIR